MAARCDPGSRWQTRVRIRGAESRRVDQGKYQRRRSTRFLPHYREITSSDQVEIYETILKDPEGHVTTGLIAAVVYLKDNRLLPDGFDKSSAVKDIEVVGDAAQDLTPPTRTAWCDIQRQWIHHRVRFTSRLSSGTSLQLDVPSLAIFSNRYLRFPVFHETAAMGTLFGSSCAE
jgi:hypothetical protein